MTIDLKTVKHISKLSRISIEDEKAKKLEKDLNSIFKFIEKLNELNTDKVEPLTSIAETTLKLRKDEIKSKNIREDILKNSPKDNKDYFVVPKVSRIMSNIIDLTLSELVNKIKSKEISSTEVTSAYVDRSKNQKN